MFFLSLMFFILFQLSNFYFILIFLEVKYGINKKNLQSKLSFNFDVIRATYLTSHTLLTRLLEVTKIKPLNKYK